VTADESRKLNKGTRVCWRDDAADCGVITETSWDALTIAWDNGQVASVHHGDVREIHLNFDKTKGVWPVDICVTLESHCALWPRSAQFHVSPSRPLLPLSLA
jgi:hypothetical protein